MATDVLAEPRARPFPLRLSEVLEAEFLAIHGYPSARPTWLLEPGHVDLHRVDEVLQQPAQSAFPAAIEALRGKIERVRRSVSADAASGAPLLDALNAALCLREPLYNHHLIDCDTDAWHVAEAFLCLRKDSRAQPAVVSPADPHVLMNRLLLEAVFPTKVITRADTVRLNRLFDQIHQLRGAEGISSALCLSGGGIRSASFGLGVLQGLARSGLLPKFDYLSTVSGGGYIGSWLSTWIHRHPHGLDGVVAELGAPAAPDAPPGRPANKLRPEPPAVRFLRSYSHFLNPKAGLFSADTWSWVGIYLRNLSLNWLVLIPLMLLVIAVPRLYAALLFTADVGHGEFFPLLFWTASIAVLLTFVCVTINRPSLSDPARPETRTVLPVKMNALRRSMQRLSRQGWILALGVAPLTLFVVLASLLVWDFRGAQRLSWAVSAQLLATTPWQDLPRVVPFVGIAQLVLWGELLVFVGWLVSSALIPARNWKKRAVELGATLLAGMVTWGLIAFVAAYMAEIEWTAETSIKLGTVGISLYPAHLFAILAIPVLMLAVLAGMTFFVGAASKISSIEDEDREWWARFGAWVLIVMVGWIALATVAILGPALLLEFPKLIAAVGGLSGLIAVVLGKSSLTSGNGQSGTPAPTSFSAVLSMLGVNSLATASMLFFAVFLAFLALLTSAALQAALGALQILPPIARACGQGAAWTGFAGAPVFSDPQVHLELVCQTSLLGTVDAMLVLGALLLVFSYLINLNKFSLHAAYRVRIVRTFLGASRRGDRRPNPFTGFDPLDDVQMHELQPGLLRETDIVDLKRFVQTLRDALLGKNGPAGELVRRMAEHDRSGVLADRLRHADPHKPVLKALQRDLIESLNRVLETSPLQQSAAFRAVVKNDDPAKFREALDQYLAHGNLIFANRLLLEGAFPDDIKAYDFPPPPPHKLMHVVNLTLNLVRGRKLAWQERKAAPFAVTPMHTGSYYLGYRESRDYGGKDGISIGTAAAISGAAVSPNMGYTSSPVTALLLTLFNVRLGWWLGNPGIAGNDTFRLAEPRFSFRPLLAEALGLTDDRSPYVYLSDGGHFDNLGLFEMVLRRCRLIVVSDAGADPYYQFPDLGNAVRKIRIDLGIPIEFTPVQIRRRKDGTLDKDGRYCALGRIRYSAVDGEAAPDGIVICIKPAIYGAEPQDVLNYAARKKAFPQETTLDQFFGESQFESYRQLGEYATRSLCARGECRFETKNAWARFLVEAARDNLGLGQEHWIDAWLESLAERREITLVGDGAKAA